MNNQEIVNQLNAWEKAYREGNALVSDQVFDALQDQLRALDPTNEYFNKGIQAESGKVKLPIKMGSLNKVTSVEEIKNWFKNKNIASDELLILTPKLDGLSLLTDHKQEAYTRGDGEFGQIVSDHFEKLSDYQINPDFIGYFVGEAILPKEAMKRNIFSDYANPRNCVASLFNTKTPDGNKLLSVDYIRYSFTPTSDFLSKLTQLDACNSVNLFQIPFLSVKLADLTDAFLVRVFSVWKHEIPYEMDGIVIDINSAETRMKLGTESNGNPAYARAYKRGFEEIKKSTILGVTWQIGKTGKLTPVARITPVELEGAMVSNVTLYNAKYVFDNKIHINDEILLKRSGGVIPKIVEFCTKHENINMRMFLGAKYFMPSLDLSWDETETDLYLDVANSDQEIKKIAYFFKTIGIENFGEPTVKALYEAGITTISQILMCPVAKLITVEGIGETTAKDLVNQFSTKIEKATWAQLCDASCIFEGLGQKSFQLIDDACMDGDFYENKLIEIDGIGPKGAKEFIEKYPLFIDFLKSNYIEMPLQQKKEKGTNYSHLNVVFTGIRDKELEQKIINGGGKVSTSISKNITHLICKDINDRSGKVEKAFEIGGIVLVQIDEFKKHLK